MLPSLFLGLVANDGSESAFATGFAATLLAGVTLWLPSRHMSRDLNIRDGFMVTALFWLVLGLFGAIPLWLAPELSLTPAEAIFESISGLTTTGATVITGLDHLPRSCFCTDNCCNGSAVSELLYSRSLFYRCWASAACSSTALRVRALKDRKLTPRITSTAKALFGIYFLLTMACSQAMWPLACPV